MQTCMRVITPLLKSSNDAPKCSLLYIVAHLYSMWPMLGAPTSPTCFVGADYFQSDHKRLLNTYREIKLLEEAVDEGVHDAPARLSQAKTHTGFSFGKCNLLKLSYLDIRKCVRPSTISPSMAIGNH